MSAYFLLLLAIISRVVPHPDWLNFTAVGGSLLFFGARRPLRQIWLPVAALAITDYYLTAFFYRYPFHVSDYLLTWAWHAAVIVFAHFLLAKKITAARVAAGVVITPTSFFLITNFAAWIANPTLYPRSLAGLGMSYVAGLPFYRNDLISTAAVAGLAFGIPVLARQLSTPHNRIAGA
ncbi:DUF6580 family putative transport protein [Silvibacterium dinghuense]|uniref:Uncharacterized protein n=1 Tax=Silvibacterium dinghuense TaxID=1560006 RepID=A0A4Q1SJN6_9BACT|nr:DUF6580 family putative transport protein [Silvibacterium dinghuense]RXS97874.1 hypothetical protein ESZ00_08450 [Silvibacterium dinghuense]GGH02647.1 hypothetical protein GCM10011586_18100 [Silvibacterium dinghuense]